MQVPRGSLYKQWPQLNVLHSYSECLLALVTLEHLHGLRFESRYAQGNQLGQQSRTCVLAASNVVLTWPHPSHANVLMLNSELTIAHTVASTNRSESTLNDALTLSRHIMHLSLRLRCDTSGSRCAG